MGELAAPPRRPRSWGGLNAVLAGLLGLVVLAAIVLATRGPGALPGTTPAERRTQEYAEVKAAAEAETTAFLTVDYQHMGPLVARVLAGATGDFRSEYDHAKVNLTSIARGSRAVSRARIRSVGIGTLDGDHATVLVAADSSVRNKSTQGRRKLRYYRFQLTLVRTGGTWLTSHLQSVS